MDVQTFLVWLVGMGLLLVIVQAIGLFGLLSRATVQHPDAPFRSRFRTALLDDPTGHGRRWLEHPWRMTVITLAIWLGTALAGTARTAVYSR